MIYLSNPSRKDFPSFSEGLSLRPALPGVNLSLNFEFPFLFGGTFIEARQRSRDAESTA